MLRSEEPERESEDLLSSQCNLNDLFNSRRILDKNFFKVIIYFPIGIFLVVIRTILCIAGLLLLCIVSKQLQVWSYIFKGLCAILGLVVEVDDKCFDQNSKLLIANHVSILDRMVVNMVKPCFTYTKGSKKRNIDLLAFWRDTDIKHEERTYQSDASAFQLYLQSSSIPVLSFAEGATTNGKVGLLKFHTDPFTVDSSIQPILIRISTPFISIAPSILGSRLYSDVFWSFFVPYIYYKLKVLPCKVRMPEESPMDFCKRVEIHMAKALNLIPTVYTSNDKLKLIKELRATHVSGNRNVSPAEEFHQILYRSRELAQKEKLTFNTAAKSFGKTPKERMLSYQERKTMLIEAARIKYLEKEKLL